MEQIRKAFYPSPIGVIEMTGTEEAILTVHFTARKKAETSEWTAALEAGLRQLDEYFAGERRTFALNLQPRGTDFQRKIWAALLEVPFGRTATYGEIARAVGRPAAVRAAGAANGRNPISIIIPCHRIVGATGGLVGYGGGLGRKDWLLAHERKHAGPAGALFT
jgi:methylated-DNA-[protein]-cysteine S-methyltransferase